MTTERQELPTFVRCRASRLPNRRYAFLNRLLAVGTGEIRADGPVHVIEEIL